MMSNTGIEPANMRGVAATAPLSFVDEWKEERVGGLPWARTCHAMHAFVCMLPCCRLTFPLLRPHLTKKKKILRLNCCCHTTLVSVFPVLTEKDVPASVPTPRFPRKQLSFLTLLFSVLIPRDHLLFLSRQSLLTSAL